MLFIIAAFALLFGLLFTRVTDKLHLPDVTAYLISGVLIGPFGLGLLGIDGLGFKSAADIEQLGFITNAALGFIAFSIGSEFRMSTLRHTGKQAFIVGLLESTITAIVVDIALISLHFVLGGKLTIPAAITLGAISAATAPAATLMVVRQYKAKGRVTEILLPVVALDDAVGLAVFAVSFGIAKALAGGEVDIVSIAVEPVIEIVGSLGLGAVLGYVLSQIERIFHSNRNRVSLVIGFVVATVGLSMLEFDIGSVHISFSSLLVCMMLGTIFCNTSPLSEDLMDKADMWTAPLMVLFFVISGASLDLSVFEDVAVIGIGAAYIIFRCVGKYFGARISSGLAKCDPMVNKWLGITLFPQAGVALGMCVTAAELPGDGPIIRNIILFSVLIYELFGPPLTKFALTRSGDITPAAENGAARRSRLVSDAQTKA